MSDNPAQENPESQRTDGESDEHSDKPKPQISAASAKPEPKQSPCSHKIPCKKHRDWVDYGELALGVIGLLVVIGYTTFAALQWCTANGQLEEMRKANAVSQENYLRDQRAWIGFALPEGVEIQKEVPSGKPIALLVPTQVVNTGKTPAHKVTGPLVITVIKKGDKLPLGDYSPGHTHYMINSGTMFPGGADNGAMPAIKHGPKKAITIIPTDALMQEINIGRSFAVVYGRVTYCDIFGVSHWTTFCRYASRPGFIDHDCMNYNDADNNEAPDPNSCPVTKPLSPK